MKRRFFAGAMAVCISLSLFPTTAFAADGGETRATAQYYSDVSDIIGSITPPDTGKDEAAQPESGLITLPNADDLQTNEDFKRYDPGYPEKEVYGNYVLRVPDLNGRLTFSTRNQNQLIGTLYAPGVSKNKGWQDATKQWHNIDNGLCFAASSSNLISWYLNRYLEQHPDDTHGFETNAEQIFNRFRNGWDPAEGGDPMEALSWYFTGGFPSNNHHPNGSHLTDRETGGYLYKQLPNNSSDRWAPVSFDWDPQEDFSVYGSFEDNRFPFIEEISGMSSGSPFSTMKLFSKHILRQLHYGPCTISIITDQYGSNSGHAITLWGVDYDVNTGLVTNLHVTDSDDYSGLFTVKVEGGPNDSVRLVQYPYYPPVGNSTRFTRIRASVLLYAPDVVRVNQGYSGPNAEISELIPDADGTGVTVQVTNLSRPSLEYGYSYDDDSNHVVRWQSDSHFSGLKPGQYYFFARVKETSDHAAGGTSAPRPYQVQTPPPTPQEPVPAPITKVSLSLVAPATGHTPQDAVVDQEGCIVESTTWKPGHPVFEPNTDYSVSIVLKTDADHTFTKDTEFTLNGTSVTAVPDGENYVINYDAFSTTQDTNSGKPDNGSGWKSNSTGWWYNDANGNYVTGWKAINGYWYYFAPNGYMQTGWQKVNGYWYYFSPSGDMQTGWQKIKGYWYYFSPSGDMQTGWQKVNGYWYYFAPGGDMQTGWQKINGYWYYFAPGGDMQTGWQWINGYCYYFYPSGYMAANTWINGSYVNGSGVWVQ